MNDGEMTSTDHPADPIVDSSYADVLDESLTLPDGRTVAWTRVGRRGGTPVLRLPGTPGSRWFVRADRRVWVERDLEVITTERAGLGRSTAFPGRDLRQHADDLAAILDHLGIDRVRVVGVSGGGPHVLALAARHPDRVVAATIQVGTPLLLEDEIDLMIDQNAAAYRLVRAGDRDGLRDLLRPVYEAMKANPLAAVQRLMEQAPVSDHAVMNDPHWQLMFRTALGAAFEQSIDGWLDDTMAIFGRWDDVDLAAIRTSITWWHGEHDRNCPMSAVRRLVDRLPTATLEELGDVGHFATYALEADILDELLARGPSAER